MRRSLLYSAASAAALAGVMAAAGPASAQVRPLVYGGAEIDTDDLMTFQVGGTIQDDRPGWSPWLNLFVFRSDFPVTEEETVSGWGVAPSLGLRHRALGGAVVLNVGWAFVDEEPGPPIFLGGESGFTTGFLGDWWGVRGDLLAQAAVNYNWGADYIWGRGRASQRVAALGRGPGSFRLGGEVSGQAGLDGTDYRAFQLGPFLELETGIGLTLTGGGGIRWDNRITMAGDDTLESVPYFRFEFLFTPVRVPPAP